MRNPSSAQLGPSTGMEAAYPGSQDLIRQGRPREFAIQDLLKIARRRYKWMLVVGGITLALTSVKAVRNRVTSPIYAGGFQLLIKDPISTRSSEGASDFSQLALNRSSTDIPTLISVLRSPLVLSDLAKEFGMSAGGLGSMIRITPSQGDGGAGILNINITTTNLDQGQVLVRRLATTYLNAAKEQKQLSIRNGMQFLDDQAPILKAKASELYQELENFRQKHNVIEADKEAAEMEQSIASYRQELRALEINRQTLERLKTQVQQGRLTASDFTGEVSSGTSSGGGSISGGLQIGGMDPGLITQLTQIEDSLAKARSLYNPNSLVIKRLEAQKKRLKPLLLKSQLNAINTALIINNDQIEGTEAEIAFLKKDFDQQPALVKEFQKITGELEMVNENLASLQTAKDQFGLEMAQESVPWRLMTPAYMSTRAIGPSVNGEITKGALLAVILGFSAGYIRDRLDHVFHTPKEVEEDMNYPLLGHIPHVELFQGVREDKRFILDEIDSKSSNSSQVNTYQRFFYQEAFRNLYTSIRFINTESTLSTLALTSSLPSEGKSLVNVLLAKTLSEMGKKVLLIDADLRKPQMHTRLGLNNLAGLSNVLIEEDLNWSDVIQNVPKYESWDVMTAGQRPPDPAQLLSSKRMEEMIKSIRDSNKYDLILLDTPPILGLADASLVASHCDGLMLLVSLNRVDRNLPQQAAARIAESGVPLVGIITNSIKQNTNSASRYGYGYGYGYGYRYGYGYGAYDTSNVYDYYSDSKEPGERTKETSSANSSKLKKLKNKLVKIAKWMDA